MTAPTGFFLHPASPLHDTGWGHPEHQGRLRALASSVGSDLVALHGRAVQCEPEPAGDEELLRVHTSAHLEHVRAAVARANEGAALVRLDPDTVVSDMSWDAALGSVGGVVTAAERVSSGELSSAFVAARPPGHHATPTRAMGFCLFNAVAIAARAIQARKLGERILVVDWDVHHGNGTQDAFYDDPDVVYVSLHEWPHYPGTGAASETGEGRGEGATLNVPLEAGTSRADYHAAFLAALDRAFALGRPDFVLISAGYDALRGDPLGGMLLEPEDFHLMTREVVGRADGAPVVAALEGGYEPKRTGLAVVATIRALAGLACPRFGSDA